MPEELEGQEEQPKKKGGMLKWIIIAVLLLVIGGGAFFMKDTIMGMLGMGGPAPDATEEAESAKDKAKAPDFQGEMTSVDPFVANLNDPLGKRYIKLGLEVELLDKPAVEDFSKANIKIKNMLLILLGSKKPQEMLGPKNQILLQQEIVDRINQIVGEGKVLHIYFSTYILQ
ncbi:MAG: flagellar basal body-associated FliL family protein [Proteobacteria bacterium]|nr:flagellar basal body-associated FliL family protein [Pseudomonadota bacterium]